MKESFDEFADKLQEQLLQEAKAVYGKIAYERWLNPKYRGVMEDADGFAYRTGSCGESMGIYLKFINQLVEKASYVTDGCASSNICGSFTAEMAIGKSPDELLGITPDEITKKAGGLPDHDRHCAELASGVLQAALENYMIKGHDNDNKHSKR
ncbi:MAG: iron-sulfur cluster assembly scaffold protein [Deltaproteobacteria bacterium]|nr:iron-sulfur cluster assembly scaffold protein [Deltaproteobacteria bacterium]MBW1914632.1 iron-sulfur cluster assembly scaffold protein [Deltaproteobacteria bacterium]